MKEDKSFEKKHISKTFKVIKKELNSSKTGKFILLAKIKVLFRRLEN